MKKHIPLASFGSILMAASMNASAVTNTMTNIVTLADACDVAAIGTDFGVLSAPIPSGGVNNVITANTATGNAVTGNDAHPNAGADGGAGNDDTLELNTPIATLNTALAAILDPLTAQALTVPGVYVACTTTPVSVTLEGPRVTGGSVNFTTTTTAGSQGPILTSIMDGVGGGAVATTNQVNYELSFTETVVSQDVLGLVNLFTGVYTSIGSIPGDQTGNTVVAGNYTDVLTATVEF
ncbi:MAG: hypothetical protein VX793_12580 [Pseudomonadota bacterium]|nr:hypothetical protein [Pseudomonadota bacterium]